MIGRSDPFALASTKKLDIKDEWFVLDITLPISNCSMTLVLKGSVSFLMRPTEGLTDGKMGIPFFHRLIILPSGKARLNSAMVVSIGVNVGTIDVLGIEGLWPVLYRKFRIACTLISGGNSG